MLCHGFAALPKVGWRRSFAESDHESRDRLTVVLISNAISKTGGSPDGAIGRRWPA
jgi:hypothetical protein